MKPKITACQVCSKEVSVNAETCPHCGEPDPQNRNTTQTKKDQVQGWAFIIAIIITATIGYQIYSSFQEKLKENQEMGYHQYYEIPGTHNYFINV